MSTSGREFFGALKGSPLARHCVYFPDAFLSGNSATAFIAVSDCGLAQGRLYVIYRLSLAKFRKAELILERYRQQLIDLQRIDCAALDSELCECWRFSYLELRFALIGLLQARRFVFLAAYYMQYERPDRPAREFLPYLAKIYDSTNYDSAGRKAKQAAFWYHYFGTGSMPRVSLVVMPK